MPHEINMTTIEKATLLDVNEINILVNKAYRGESSKKGWTTEADLLDGLRIDEDTLAAYINDEDAAVLKHSNGERITGCIYLKVNKNKLYICMLTVEPELQNTGIGNILLKEADKYADKVKCDTLWMTVISARKELIEYYERKGFKLTGEIRPFPENPTFGIKKKPIELIVMEKHKELTGQ